MSVTAPFPFDDVVGQDDAKLALRLAATDPLIGGVLLRGQKGSAKTTLARGLAALLGGGRFVDLPLGATEDRLVGTLDTATALSGGGVRFEPGLLAEAHGGVLYVDEINLLPDHLVDVLLDVAASGENVVERDAVSHRHPARFVLVGSMNPEEGELRPQLLDRFGLCVEVTAPLDLQQRVEAVRRRLAFDRSPAHPADDHATNGGTTDPGATDGDATGPVGRERSPAAPGPSGASAIGARGPEPVTAGPEDTTPGPGTRVDQEAAGGIPILADAVIEAASTLALAVGAEGLRADLALCRAATALAALDGRDRVEPADLRRVAPLVLAHRSRRGPFDPPVVSPDDLADAISSVLPPAPPDGGAAGPSPDPSPPTTGADHRDDPDPSAPTTGADHRDDPDPSAPTTEADDGDGPEAVDAGDRTEARAASGAGRPGDAAGRPLVLGSIRRPPPLDGRTGPAPRGRVVGDRRATAGDAIAVVPTVRAAVRRLADDPGAPLAGADLRSAIRVAERPLTVVLCVDLSGSMGAPERAAAASGTALGLLAGAYERRNKVGLVTFSGEGARVVLSPTSSVEIAGNRLADLVTGGATPLAAGLEEAGRLAERSLDGRSDALLTVLTDGRATGSGGFDDALTVAAGIARSPVDALVLDCESGPGALGLAARLAAAMGARHVPVADLAPAALVDLVSASASRTGRR